MMLILFLRQFSLFQVAIKNMFGGTSCTVEAQLDQAGCKHTSPISKINLADLQNLLLKELANFDKGQHLHSCNCPHSVRD